LNSQLKKNEIQFDEKGIENLFEYNVEKKKKINK